MAFEYRGSARLTARVALMCAMATIGCGSLGGPGAPERSIAGSYRGSWHFGIYDPDTIARGDDPPGVNSRGHINCPGELRVTEQDGRSIRGDFALLPPGPFSACVSRQPGFCSQDLVETFCRQISGSLSGEAFSNGSPSAHTTLYTFRMRIAEAEGRAALSRFLGCVVVREEKDVFSGGVHHADGRASASVQATAECGGRAALERVDVSIRLEASYVSQ